MTKQAYRRLAGLILGAVIGLIFGAVSQGVNPALMPGVPLYQPPFGMIGNTALMTLLGGLLGLLSAWTEPSIPGILLSGAAAAAMLLISNTFTSQLPALMAAANMMVAVFLLLPFSAMAAVGTGLVRTAVNNLTDYRNLSLLHPRRWWLAVLILIAAGGLGYAMLLSPSARTVLVRTQDMLQQGLAAENAADLPSPLRGNGMDDFLTHAAPGYTLDWENKNLTRYAIPRPGGPEYLMSVAVVRFDNGWNMACLYPNVEAEPRCHSFDELP